MARRTNVALLALFVLLSSQALRAADDWKLTGTATREKSIAFVSVNVYTIEHFVKELPKTKSKRAMIDLDAAKKFVWTMRRDVGAEKIRDALAEAFELNGYKDEAKIKKFTAAFTKELEEKSHVTIVYDPAKKETTVSVDGGGTATVGGVDFMKGVWSIWFGKIDQEDLGDQLLSKLQ